MKWKRKIWLLLSLALLCCALLAGCGEDSKGTVTEIFILKTDMPRLNYVQGQALDLQDGVLTAVINDETTPVPLNGEGVTVTGYNPDQLGKQTVTVTYQGKTTTFDVTVNPRAVAEGYEENFFVGDSFDSGKGKIRITKDNGSTVAVNMNSSDISVKSFDSSRAGKATVTVTCQLDGQSYECTFEVNVHEVAGITLNVPNRTKYVSHETKLALNGGYLTVTAPSPSTFSKHVPLTEEMVSGYDPSVVTYENRDTVARQTVTVTYAGYQASYEVEIAYSNVHLVQYLATQLQHLDWSQEELPVLTDTESANAVTAIEAYLALSPADRSNISEDAFHAVLFPAVCALRAEYIAHLETFADAFGISADGYLQLVGKSYEAIAEAVVRLEDPEDPYNTCAALAMKIYTEFGEVTFRKGTISGMILTHDEQSVANLSGMFRYMMNLHELMQQIPADWTVQTLEEKELAVTNAISKIIIGNYRGLDYNELHRIVSSWRTNDDFFDIIYTYYTQIKAGGSEELVRDGLWQILPLPGVLNDWYVNFAQAISIEQFMLDYENTDAYLYDTAVFMYYYFKTEDCVQQILGGDNQLYKDLYEMLNLELLFEQNLRCGPRGYLYQMGQALESAKVQETWEKYMYLLELYFSDPANCVEKFGAEFRVVFDAVVELTPAELNSFLCSVNFLYDTARGNVLVLECKERQYNTLMALVGGYYRNVLPEDVYNCFCDLMLAMEYCSLETKKETAIADFNATMEKLKSAYQNLSSENKAIFDTYLGAGYEKYLTIYNRLAMDTTVNVDKWEAVMQQLLETLDAYDSKMGLLMDANITQEEKAKAILAAMVLYQQATDLHEQLMAAGEEVRVEMIAREYTIGEYTLTLERYYAAARTMFVSFMLGTGVTTETEESYMLWDLFDHPALRALLLQMSELLLCEIDGQVYTGTDVGQIMEAFRELTAAEKKSFFLMSVNPFYYSALERYFCSENEALKETVSSLLKAEIAYAVCLYTDDDGESLGAFIQAFEEAKALYEQLENQNQLDEDLVQLYAYYAEVYRKVTRFG